MKPDEIQLDFDALLVRLFHLELDSKLTPNLYSMQLAELIEKLEFNISEMAKKLIGSHANNLFEEFGLSSVKVLMMALKHNFISPSDPYIREIVVKALENIELSFLGTITALIQNSSYEDELTKLFKKEVVYSICREVTDWAIDSNQFGNIYCESELDASEIESYIEQVLSDLNHGFDFDDTEFDEVIDALDLDAIVTYNREAAEDSDRRADSYSEYADLSGSDFGIHPIDDLFDRK